MPRIVRGFLSAVLVAASVRAHYGTIHPTAARATIWRLTSTTVFDATIETIAFDHRTSDTIYIGGHTQQTPGPPSIRWGALLYKSEDGGVTWRGIQGGVVTGIRVTAMLVNPANPDIVYAGAFGGGVYKSIDRGESWRPLTSGFLPWVNALAIDPRVPDTLYVAIGGGGIYKTTDGGSTWVVVSAPLPFSGQYISSLAAVAIPSLPTRIYATTEGGLYRSDDAGATWQLLSSGVGKLLWIASTSPPVLYGLGSPDAKLLKSSDGGMSWTSIQAGLPPRSPTGFTNGVLSLVADPTSPNILYAGTEGAGVFRSINGGSGWTAINEGLSNLYVPALAIPSAGGFPVYGGTGAGLFDLRARSDFQITIPAVASLHGVPPAFFHSDVWVFNGSSQSEATVTATYRCLSGSPCTASPHTFTIAPRHVKTFRDIAVSLFNSPETAGAVEFESNQLIVVGSRLYTPDSSQPTTGMFVPGSKPEEASASQVLTSLSHSADLSTGFRTNVGFYNATDTASFVDLAFFEPSGGSLGQIHTFVAPHQPLQLNDGEVFERLGIVRDVPDFYCTVTAYGDTHLLAYAAVIDNQSGDPFFVSGQSPPGLVVASIGRSESPIARLSPAASQAAGWRLTSTELFDVRITAIEAYPRSADTMYVGGYRGGLLHQRVALFRSDDAGSTWRQIQNNLLGMSVAGLEVNPANPDVVYAGVYGGGVFKSVDRGESWTRLTVGQFPWVGSLVMDERSPDTLYVSISGDGTYKTTDAGNTWTLVGRPSRDPDAIVVWGIVPDPSTEGRLYAVDLHRLYRSDDAGRTWQLVREGIRSLLWIDPTDSAILYALAESGGLLKTTNRGLTWTPIGAGLPTDVGLRALLGDPANRNILYIGTTGRGVFLSLDGGSTWSAFNEGIANRSVGPLLIPASGNPALYAGTDAGLFDYRPRAEFQVTVPAVASLHGVPPAFFHSDVWIFNGSADSAATVSATYRCLSGSPCSGSPQTFTIPPRQVKIFRDIAVSLFNAPESAGAVELESDHLLVVTSRLYTPGASQPTTGMFVPGLKPEEASAQQVLTSLSHSVDATTGFRTNVGFYNPTDSGTFVSLAFFEDTGAGLGEIIVFGYPRRPLQLNDSEIFQRLGISRDIANFYCVVTAYPNETQLHSYAAVIDNRSQDPIFVPGEDDSEHPPIVPFGAK